MVRSFIKNVLGVDNDHSGLYSKTSGYYGTVEQQGRLTLHLHLLLWIEGALSPQEIRDKLMSEDSAFQKELVEYLESAHKGEFHTGSMDDVRRSIPVHIEARGGMHATLCPSVQPVNNCQSEYADPTQTLPRPAPSRCEECPTNECEACKQNASWWKDYYHTVDDLLLKSNVHQCTSSRSDGSTDATGDDMSNATLSKAKRASVKQGPKGCIDGSGICRARFPRDLHEKTVIDAEDGHVTMKKLEAYLNTFTPCLTYLFHCNTDVTSLLSGTSIKAIVSYISDYVTKPALKTHQILASVYDVFERNRVLLAGDVKAEDNSCRRLILKIVNALSAKLEIGSPMASMYLLQNPDHYTGHSFVPFWWKSYVSHIWQGPSGGRPESGDASAYENLDGLPDHSPIQASSEQDRVKLGREAGVYFATTNVDDYKHRPDAYSSVSLYEWIQCAHRRRASKKEMETLKTARSREGSSSGYLAFQEDHPMQATHLVKCNFDRLEMVVPNIVGGPLPRHDRGNREYYCCTMLTLFRPWRTGTCLKQGEQSWGDAFKAYEFSPKQKQLMRNFDLRYECLDARDDFHAQLRKMKAKHRGVWPDKGDTDEDCSDDEYIQPPSTGRIDQDTLGRSYLFNLKMMDSISATLRTAGWFDRCCDIVAQAFERLQPEYLPGSAWANIIKNNRDAIFKERFTGYCPSRSVKQDTPHLLSRSSELVRVLPADYFCKDFRAEKARSNELIDDTAKQFSLNKEQERAFRIVANHASMVATEQLRMYLGGMGGTGKSQVIRALIHLFESRKESHRFVALAPTGTVAALLNGSTYHKALGIQRKGDVGEDFSKSESAILNQARTRLQGVEYIFIDEVSMVACHELYSISARLAQITGVHDVAFGGVNVIFAGDFAQLPPVMGKSLYDGTVEKFVDSKMSVRAQETVIGKILWHQITTVIILKENMRQKSQTEDDAKLRTALINMRYAACSQDDIEFLRSRIAGRGSLSPKLNDPRFRHVSIITARNNQRDRINEEGSQRFADDHGLELSHFYSLDELASSNLPGRRRRKKVRRKPGISNPEPSFDGLTREDQEALWNCSPHMSDHLAAKLSLCIGLPVMIRNNEATEMCITKGQEGTVVGWDAFEGPYGRQVLETLFIRLVDPPKDVQLADLPTNVVPLTRFTAIIQCKAKSDQPIGIRRQQVPVLPNFAMTNYVSQGKTRRYNVVDLGYCRDHQSYYTALSRSASAEGTVLIQGFSEAKITRGISGWLRQEFRELNVLDKVTCLRYEGLLPDGIHGPLRNPVVRAYYLWMKDKKDDSEWHPAIRYKDGESRLKPIEADATWDTNIAASSKKEQRKSENLAKRPGPFDAEDVDPPQAKIVRTDPSLLRTGTPLGIIWNSKDYSCAYDSFFTVLYNIWSGNPTKWSRRFQDVSGYMSSLSEQFQLVGLRSTSIEDARDAVRAQLRLADPSQFPNGPNSTCVASLSCSMMGHQRNRACGSSLLTCLQCGHQGDLVKSFGEWFQLTLTGPFQDDIPEECSVSDCLGWQLSEQQKTSRFNCPSCFDSHHQACRLSLEVSAVRLPYIMCAVLSSFRFRINRTLTYQDEHTEATFHLRGIVYGDGHHFVSRIVDDSDRVWFHDGIATRSSCLLECQASDITDEAWWSKLDWGYASKRAVIAVYARQ